MTCPDCKGEGAYKRVTRHDNHEWGGVTFTTAERAERCRRCDGFGQVATEPEAPR